jgi:hypothetical protein
MSGSAKQEIVAGDPCWHVTIREVAWSSCNRQGKLGFALEIEDPVFVALEWWVVEGKNNNRGGCCCCCCCYCLLSSSLLLFWSQRGGNLHTCTMCSKTSYSIRMEYEERLGGGRMGMGIMYASYASYALVAWYKYRPRPRNVMMESWNHGLSNTLTKKQLVERGYALLAAGSRVGTRESVRACESEKIVCVCLSMASPAELTSSTCHLHCSTYGTHYLGTVFAVNPTTTASTFDIAQLLQTGTCIFIEHHNPRSTATTTRVQGGG